MDIPTYGLKLLKNMWNACTNDALRALSEMIKKEIKLKFTSIKIEILNNLPKIIDSGKPDNTLIYIKLKNSVKGVFLVSSSLKDTLNIIETIMGKRIGYYEALSEENIPVICELGYILSGYYISSLVKLFGGGVKWEEPVLSTNPVRVIEEFDMGPVYKEKIYIIAFRAVFNIFSRPKELQITLLFRKQDVPRLLEAISEKVSFKIN